MSVPFRPPPNIAPRDGATRSSDQSGFAWPDSSAAIVLVPPLVVAGILIVISALNALLHAAVVLLSLVTLGYRRQNGAEQ